MSTMPVTDADRGWMELAIDLAHQCPPSESAYSVGAVVVAACTQLILGTGISRVVIAWHEPALLVADCRGRELLEEAGVEVAGTSELADRAREPDKHLAL